MGKVTYSFALSALILLATPTARAEDPAIREAKVRFDEGVALHDAGRDEEARLKFAEAYAVLRAPEILFNLARSEQLTGGHGVEAIRHFRRFLRLRAPSTTDDQRRMAESYIGQLASSLGRVRVQAPLGTTVTIDGVAFEQGAPFEDPIDLAVGVRVLEARFGPRVKQVRVQSYPGVEQEVFIQFDATQTPAGSEPASGRVPVVVSAGALAVAALGLGVGFAIDSNSKLTDVAALRARNACADLTSASCSEMRSKYDSGTTSSSLATGFYITGGVLAVGGLVAWLVWPTRSVTERTSLSPTLGRGGLGLDFRTQF